MVLGEGVGGVGFGEGADEGAGRGCGRWWCEEGRAAPGMGRAAPARWR